MYLVNWGAMLTKDSTTATRRSFLPDMKTLFALYLSFDWIIGMNMRGRLKHGAGNY
jgi:hypothetical protein